MTRLVGCACAVALGLLLLGSSAEAVPGNGADRAAEAASLDALAVPTDAPAEIDPDLLEPTSIPEPDTAALLVFGLVVLAGIHRSRTA